MNPRVATTIIDTDKCTGCGLCVKTCPFQTISIQDKKAVVSGSMSVSCGHCAAICPVGAIRVTDIADETARFSTFQADRKWLPHGQFDTAKLVRLMGSRRSCRSFKDMPVDRAILEDLVKIGITAPSGTNNQLWTFTLLPSHEAVRAFAGKVSGFYKKAIRTTNEQFLSPEYREVIGRMLSDWEDRKIDRIFHGAPAAIIVGSRPGASCPAEDALLATQNILLAAHSMGLGTCLIGFAVSAMGQDASLKSILGIPQDEQVHSAVSLGYPDESYRMIPARKQYTRRYFEG